VLPWPVLCLLTVGIIIACCVPLTALLAWTPLAVPLTGRKRVPWPRRGTTPPFGMKILSFPNGGVVPQAVEH
jgi:hypothetical protein